METTAAAVAARDWSALPADLLLIAMSSMEVPDVVRAGAVCTSWRSAYAAFRALRRPTPRQPPCLLYYARTGGATADDPGTPTLYSPSTGASFRVPLLEPCGGYICSAHGWLLVTDKAANPYLLNPLTGTRAALPPVTTLDRVANRSVDADGGVMYDLDYSSPPYQSPHIRTVTAREVQQWMFHRAAISGAPGGGDASSCVVLLVHMPYELSFARPGDDRWTSLSHLIDPLDREGIKSVTYSEDGGLFLTLGDFGALHAVDLKGPSPSAWLCTRVSEADGDVRCTAHLAPSPSGVSVMMATLTSSPRRSGEPPEEFPCPRNGTRVVLVGEHERVITTDVEMYRISPHGTERLAGTGEHALFLGRSSALYLPVERLPASMSKWDRAYLTLDVATNTVHSPESRLDVLVWDFESGSLQKLGDDAQPLRPWLDCPAPIWIIPSLY